MRRLALSCRILNVVAGLVLASGSALLLADEPAPKSGTKPVAGVPVGAELTVESIERQLAAVDGLPDLDDAARDELRALYADAVAALKRAKAHALQTARLKQTVEGAEERLKSVKAQLAAQGEAVKIEIPDDAKLARLEKLLDAAEKALEEARRNKAAADAEIGRRQARQAEIAAKTGVLREQRGKLKTELAVGAAVAGPKAEAIRTRSRAKMAALDAELRLCDQELATYSATAELLQPERDLANKIVDLAQKRMAQWHAAVEARRKFEAARQQKSADEKARAALAELKPLAQKNKLLAKRSGELVRKIQAINASLDAAKKVLAETERNFTITKEKVDRVGLNYAIGLLLRKQETDLPDVRKYRYNNRQREEIIRDVQLRIIDLAEERSVLTDVDYVESLVTEMMPTSSRLTPFEFRSEVEKLVKQQLEFLTTLQQNENGYFERLVELESVEQQLVKLVTDYENYISERVLWIKSSSPMSLEDFSGCGESILWLVDARQWRQVAIIVWEDFRARPLPFLLMALLWVLLLLVQPRLRGAVNRIGQSASRGGCRDFSPTMITLVWTVLISALWPLLILILAWRLSISPECTGFVAALSYGLGAAGTYYAALEFFRQVCRTHGLADAHFDWPPGARVALRTDLRWLMAVSIPLVFAASMFFFDATSRSPDAPGIIRSQESIATLCTIGVLVTSMIFTHYVFKPEGLLFRAFELTSAETRLYRYRRIWYWLPLLVLFALIVLEVAGYHYTVNRLAICLMQSIVLLQLLVVALSLVRRWLVIVRRRMAIQRAQHRRASATRHGEAITTAVSSLPDDEGLGVQEIGDQSRQLLQVSLVLFALLGLWWIWADVLPAIHFLERFELWTVKLDGEIIKITVNHLLVGGVVVVFTVLATKNIPGLLELVVLSRLPLNAGTRYALTTICRYLIAITGVVVAFRWIGISWSSYQWLVAAMTVGLGFGLQEIFANFVSGLIVLFEQPIRVGDIVTIDNVTGVVSKIRMRATTVTDWDRKDFIVPNREFITGRLLNWTLTSPINRVVVKVGVAYDSDAEQVRRLLLAIARDHPLVMDDPAPTVTFEEFGESTLDFVLRCYLPDLDNRLAVIHELHATTHRELGAAGIEFAFPTREVHIRSHVGFDQNAQRERN